MLLFVQFLVRLSFGMAAAMTMTSPRLVTSGYYRNNCYVLLGLNVLTALALWSGGVTESRVLPWLATAAAAVSYVAAVLWLYEKPRAGIEALRIIGGLSMFGVVLTAIENKPSGGDWLWALDALVAAMLVGTTMAAMLLGHWYLNAPGMQIGPLLQLTNFIGVAVVLRAVVSGLGLLCHLELAANFEFVRLLMLLLRWLTAVVGTAGLVFMTRATLKIPNTQAATGLLYVAVVTTFLGELLGQLLSAGAVYPL